jgi:exonuclease SbcD
MPSVQPKAAMRPARSPRERPDATVKSAPVPGERSDDFIKVVLTDDAPVIDGMKRIRYVFPNACELLYERNERAPEVKSLEARAMAVASPVEVIGDFLEHVRDERLSENELAVVASALGRLRETEDMQ